MQISLSDTGKRFNSDWIFRKLSYEFRPGCYAITGPNGSGKSTLLQIIAGAVGPSEGSLTYIVDGRKTDHEQAYRSIAVAAPYLEVIEEMTLYEFLHFHSRFKPFLSGYEVTEIISQVALEDATNKQIRYFSSGMKQRLKLAQAFFSDVPCLLLDEPCTNLDSDGIALYHRLVQELAGERLVIISSNDPQEYGFCEEVVDIRNFKP